MLPASISQALDTLADYTNPALMVPTLKSTSPVAIIAELSSTLQQGGRLTNLVDSAILSEAVMTRELLSATSISPGWALPHARLKGLTQLSFALGRSSQPIVWLGKDRVRVQTIFLFAVPEAEAKAYLNLIAAVARFSQTAGLIEQLGCARDGRGMFRVLQQVALRRPRAAASGAQNVPATTLGAVVN